MKGSVDPSIEEGLIQFFDARDEFVHGDKLKGLEMLRLSDHPEAVALCKLFESIEPTSDEEIVRCIQESRTTIGISYHALFTRHGRDLACAANLGHPYSVTLYAELYMGGDAGIPLLTKAAQDGERCALYYLGRHLSGIGWHGRALECFRVAAKLNERRAKAEYAYYTLPYDDPKRYVAFGEACIGHYHNYVRLLDANDDDEDLPLSCVFMIGRYMSRISRGDDDDSESVHLYRTWIHDTQEAVLAWLLVAKRLGLYRDVARLIAQEVWRLRETWYPEPLLLF